MPSIVIFYSKTGSTKAAAEYIARNKNAEICPVVELKKRKGFFGFMGGAREALKQVSSKIESDSVQAIKGKDLIYLGTPIWAGCSTPAINAFISSADLQGKKVVLFTMQADAQLEGSRLVAESLSSRIRKKGGEIVQTLAFHGCEQRKEPDFKDIEEQLSKADIV